MNLFKVSFFILIAFCLVSETIFASSYHSRGGYGGGYGGNYMGGSSYGDRSKGSSPSATLSVPTSPQGSTSAKTFKSSDIMAKEGKRLKDPTLLRTEVSVNDKFFNALWKAMTQFVEEDGTVDPKQIQSVLGIFAKKLQTKKLNLLQKMKQVRELADADYGNKEDVLKSLSDYLEILNAIEQKFAFLPTLLQNELNRDVFPTALKIFEDLTPEYQKAYTEGLRAIDVPKGFKISPKVLKASFNPDLLKILAIQRLMKNRQNCQSRTSCAALDQKALSQYEQTLQKAMGAFEQQMAQSSVSGRGGRRTEEVTPQDINTDAMLAVIDNIGVYMGMIPNQSVLQRYTITALAAALEKMFMGDQGKADMKTFLVKQEEWRGFVTLKATGSSVLPWVDEKKEEEAVEEKKEKESGLGGKAKKIAGGLKGKAVEAGKKKVDEVVDETTKKAQEAASNIVNNLASNLFGGVKLF